MQGLILFTLSFSSSAISFIPCLPSESGEAILEVKDIKEET